MQSTVADLGLSLLKEEILKDSFGSEARKEKGIIDSESTHEFLASVESLSLK